MGDQESGLLLLLHHSPLSLAAKAVHSQLLRCQWTRGPPATGRIAYLCLCAGWGGNCISFIRPPALVNDPASIKDSDSELRWIARMNSRSTVDLECDLSGHKCIHLLTALQADSAASHLPFTGPGMVIRVCDKSTSQLHCLFAMSLKLFQKHTSHI